MTQAEIINRIEAEAKSFEDKNPYDALHSAYYMGAKSERNKVLNEAIEKIKLDERTNADIYNEYKRVYEILTSLKVDL